MPNWCNNKVEIYGDGPDQIKEVKKTLAGKKTCFDFNNIVPMPKELEGNAPHQKPIRLKLDAYANNTDTITGTIGVVIIGILNGTVLRLLLVKTKTV